MPPPARGDIRCDAPMPTLFACARDGTRLREDMIQSGNTCRDMRSDTACRYAQNEERLGRQDLNNRIHRRKPQSR